MISSLVNGTVDIYWYFLNYGRQASVIKLTKFQWIDTIKFNFSLMSYRSVVGFGSMQSFKDPGSFYLVDVIPWSLGDFHWIRQTDERGEETQRTEQEVFYEPC